MGFDQMMVFYDHFLVTRSKITATFMNGFTNNLFKVFVRVDGNNSVVTSSEDLSELGGNVYDTVTPLSSTGCVKSLTTSVDVAKFHGQNPSAITASESLAGSAGSSPSDGIFYHISAFSPIGSTGSVTVQFVIDYEAIFFEPRTQVPSLTSLTTSVERARTLNEARVLNKQAMRSDHEMKLHQVVGR